MKKQNALTAAALLALSALLATGCAKSEPAVSTASPTPAAVASTPAAPVAAPPTDLQPSPGSPVATFTPKSNTPAPMLPTLDAAPAAVDEHGHSTSSADAPRIGPEEAAMLVQSGDAIILDVRSPDAFAARHIQGAVNIPLEQVASRARAELTPTRWIIPYCT